jgi:BirA family biotin operon repressor/biotin-[acetyl-CoA-carboxylase] ligase
MRASVANPGVPGDPGTRRADAPAAARGALPLPALLDALAADEAVSGRRLAERFGVTRAAVWKQIERLRALGLGIAAEAGGYRLAAPVDRLDAKRLSAELAPAERARVGDLAVHWELDSTSSELLRRAADDPRDRLVCLAEIQTRGRGRRGRAWRMPLGGGIALSVLKRFDAGMAALSGLSLVAGIAAVQALEDCGVAGVGLKWPNDLVARGRKLGGILVELGGDALGPCHATIGIGLNVRLDAAAAAQIDQPWIDLAALAGDAVPPRNRLAARVLARLFDALEQFAQSGFAAFAADYARRDALCGLAVRVLRADHAQEGVACGVDERGALRVAFADGERSVDSGEVSVRVQA